MPQLRFVSQSQSQSQLLEDELPQLLEQLFEQLLEQLFEQPLLLFALPLVPPFTQQHEVAQQLLLLLLEQALAQLFVLRAQLLAKVLKLLQFAIIVLLF